MNTDTRLFNTVYCDGWCDAEWKMISRYHFGCALHSFRHCFMNEPSVSLKHELRGKPQADSFVFYSSCPSLSTFLISFSFAKLPLRSLCRKNVKAELAVPIFLPLCPLFSGKRQFPDSQGMARFLNIWYLWTLTFHCFFTPLCFRAMTFRPQLPSHCWKEEEPGTFLGEDLWLVDLWSGKLEFNQERADNVG